MTNTRSLTELPWSQGGRSGVMRVITKPDDFVELELGELGKCSLPNSVLRTLMITLLNTVRKNQPPFHWTEADRHYTEWDSHAENQQRRLMSDFRNFMEVFIYLASLEFNRTENSVRWKLNGLDLRKHLP
ncbi:hypothetical protein DK847_16655 [Aestuariivirga litoralis]|uniref:Uncharacterized protein n=1 Tax=Aestuariivirga litoralis TaxID=2650924 RepID=A0A2W2ATH6_9HYPH|nr:hypothetical protein [Aestuariivirga litoralis]PZF75850.1 hypothetical protein DK847_16655 [Aestuariivirga litoralis]